MAPTSGLPTTCPTIPGAKGGNQLNRLQMPFVLLCFGNSLDTVLCSTKGDGVFFHLLGARCVSKGKEGRICQMDSGFRMGLSRRVLLFSVPAHSAPFRDLRLMRLTPGTLPHSFRMPHSSHLPPSHALSPPRMPSHGCISRGALAQVSPCAPQAVTLYRSSSCLCTPSSHQGLAHLGAQELLPAQEGTRGTPLQHSTLSKLNHTISS